MNFKNHLEVNQDQFKTIAKTHEAVNFEKECHFALQHLEKNDFLKKVAQNNLQSLNNAILNVASIGISLCPQKKHAYLLPRKIGNSFTVCLDLSYMGLIHIAIQSGAIEWVQAKIVRKNDLYEFKGMGEMPTHKYNSFLDRGEIVGVYCVAKIANGYLTEEMPIDDVYKIRDRSESYKAFKNGKARTCVWITDSEEMIKKTVVKRAYKYWPHGSDRLTSAVAASNEVDSIDFEKEQKIEIEESQKKEIREILKAIDRTEDDFLKFSKTVIKKDIPINEFSKSEADLILIALRDIKKKLEPKNIELKVKDPTSITVEDIEF